MDTATFWQAIDTLVHSSEIMIDRPKGSIHPRYPDSDPYLLDYGYLKDTSSSDGHGIDVWVGSLAEPLCTAIIVNVDLFKRDSEIKLLLGCTKEEGELLLSLHNVGLQSAILLERGSN